MKILADTHIVLWALLNHDKLLIAQAKTEGMVFLTHDSLLADYQESCIMVV